MNDKLTRGVVEWKNGREVFVRPFTSEDYPHVHNGIYQCCKCGKVLL